MISDGVLRTWARLSLRSRWDVSILLSVLILSGSITGCGALLTRDLGYAGAHPGYLECKGKGTVTGQGQQSVAAGYGGAGLNGFTLTVDCGEGMSFRQGPLPLETQK